MSQIVEQSGFKHSLTTPMHADRRELIGYDAEVLSTGGDGES